MIVEHTIDYPATILNKERYAYYKECERKANLSRQEIREEAIRLFGEWATKTDFKVEISMLSLRKTFTYSRKTSFFCEWLRDKWIGDKELKDLGFQFEKSLNEAVNEFVSEAYKEHRKELEAEFDARQCKRAKSYLKMRKTVIIQWGVMIALGISLVLTNI